MDIIIDRIYRSDCTLGEGYLNLKTEDPTLCFKTLELPWLNNQKKISCIPEGIYSYQFYESPKFGKVILINNVPKRSMIEIHPGNFTSDIQGCILPGDAHTDINGDGTPDVTNSRDMMRRILEQAPKTGHIEFMS